jgi:hypothetical protein
MIKHEWFASFRQANERLPFDFDDKENILILLEEIESKRNLLCYGKPQPIELIESFLDKFNELKSLFEEKGLKWN